MKIKFLKLNTANVSNVAMWHSSVLRATLLISQSYLQLLYRFLPWREFAMCS
jgi:hypothetical protein